MPGLKTKYTAEFRIEIADYIISTGRPITQVAEELGILPIFAPNRADFI